MSNVTQEKQTFYQSFDTDEFPLPQTPDSNDFIPLDPGLVTPNKVADFPIFVFIPQKQRFVLFKSESASIKEEQLQYLSKGGRKPVFVPKENVHELNHFLSEDLNQIVNDPELPVAEKSQKFHNMANVVMKSLFESPPDMSRFLETAENVSNSLASLVQTDSRSILELYQLRSYDYYTYSHSMNVCVLCMGLFMDMFSNPSPEELEDLSRGVLLHDIGKCDIPTELTNKKGPLNEHEWAIMRSHTEKGFKRLRKDEDLTKDSRLISLYHHEATDGTGYPHGIEVKEIPFTSRLCKVVDVFDALTSKRSYKNGMTPYQALELMTVEMKNKIDQDLLKQFILFLDKMGKLRG